MMTPPTSLPIARAEWISKECDVCASGAPLEILGQRNYFWPTRKNVFEMKLTDALCTGCGFIFVKNIPSSDDFLNQYYGDAYFLNDQSGIKPDFDTEARLRFLKKFLKSGDSIIEMGANSGAFCETLTREGFPAQGMDLLDSGHSQVESVLKSGRSSADQELPKAVVSYYLLEHITRPNDWIASIKSQFLGPDSYLLTEIPSFLTHPHESLNHEHFLHFTPYHLGLLLKRQGLTPLAYSYEDRSRDFGFAMMATNSSHPGSELDLSPLRVSPDRMRAIYQESQKTKDILDQARWKTVREVEALAKTKDSQIFLWGANEIASDLASKFLELGVHSVKVVDNNSQKIGRPHLGFSDPTFSPGQIVDTGLQNIFVICSVAWASAISEQISKMNLAQTKIIRATESK